MLYAYKYIFNLFILTEILINKKNLNDDPTWRLIFASLNRTHNKHFIDVKIIFPKYSFIVQSFFIDESNYYTTLQRT
jgi:hypothetical protein